MRRSGCELPFPDIQKITAPYLCRESLPDLWFYRKDREEQLLAFQKVLLQRVVGFKLSPNEAEWQMFILVGCFLAEYHKKYLLPPKKPSEDWYNKMEILLWEVLWRAYANKKEIFNNDFISLCLQLLMPKDIDARPPYWSSDFCMNWYRKEFSTDLPGLQSNISLIVLKQGAEYFDKLADKHPEIANEINRLAFHGDRMVAIANKALSAKLNRI